MIPGPSGTSQFLSRRRAKHQAPNPKLQRSSKSQTPNPNNRCLGERRAGRFLSLELGASMELGVWNLELVAWALSFSRIEMRPDHWAHLDTPTIAEVTCSLSLRGTSGERGGERGSFHRIV